MFQFQIGTIVVLAVLLTHVAANEGYNIFRKPSESYQQCTARCIRPYYIYPVCGTDGRTYTNIRLLKCAQQCGRNVSPKYVGRCQKKITKCLDRCVYPFIYDPVCGTDGITYPNEYALECSQDCDLRVNQSYTGRCEGDINDCINQCSCTADYRPVCGSNNVTYSNKCKLLCAQDCGRNVIFKYNGKCRVCPNGCRCSKIYAPVCGSNNQTYSNKCTLDCARNCYGKKVKFDYNGKCRRCPKGCFCPAIYEPVCGSNNQTYSSGCTLDCARECDGIDVCFDYKGKCQSEQECRKQFFCTADDNPVCGSDHHTYSNNCTLVVARKCKDKYLKFAYNGPCCGYP